MADLRYCDYNVLLEILQMDLALLIAAEQLTLRYINNHIAHLVRQIVQTQAFLILQENQHQIFVLALITPFNHILENKHKIELALLTLQQQRLHTPLLNLQTLFPLQRMQNLDQMVLHKIINMTRVDQTALNTLQLNQMVLALFYL